MKFKDKLINSISNKESSLCVGLDSNYVRISQIFKNSNEDVGQVLLNFNLRTIESTYKYAAAYKANLSFYYGQGIPGIEALLRTNHYLKHEHPDIPLLADGKRSEMGETVEFVRKEICEELAFDCIMCTPWFGFDTIRDLISDETIGVAIYVHDSNPTASELQSLSIKLPEQYSECFDSPSGEVHLYELLAYKIANEWNTKGNVFVEAGLTYPVALRRIRAIVGADMPILTAGLGAQGGQARDLKGLGGIDKSRILVNVSRSLLFGDYSARTYFVEMEKMANFLKREIQEAL